MSYNTSISGSNLKKLLISATNLLLSYPYSFCIWSIEQSHFLYHKYENSQSQNPEVKVDSINMPHIYALSLSRPRILLDSIHQALPKNREMHINFYFREHHPIATYTSWYLSHNMFVFKLYNANIYPLLYYSKYTANYSE